MVTTEMEWAWNKLSFHFSLNFHFTWVFNVTFFRSRTTTFRRELSTGMESLLCPNPGEINGLSYRSMRNRLESPGTSIEIGGLSYKMVVVSDGLLPDEWYQAVVYVQNARRTLIPWCRMSSCVVSRCSFSSYGVDLDAATATCQLSFKFFHSMRSTCI